MKWRLSRRRPAIKMLSLIPLSISTCSLSRDLPPLEAELRLDKLPLNVRIVDDIKPYKERKVAILNGAHTALVPVAFQAGIDTVVRR
ncbi:altronate oxidoreductase [Klebsiella pneumoniae]|uniref:Altronate oxidoreductase n=1 Tax=Klebsiella pneumoniae TaxID=573 RepID=A0A377W6D9_KLEPN|nr:altronate oxidoreductase [Klebsiella pneumoniae]